MTQGINMGRKCPWTKGYLESLYGKLNTYCKVATMHALKHEGQQVAMQTMSAYNMFKYPVVYIFVHYHWGRPEDLGMSNDEVSSYMMYLSVVKHFTTGMMEGMVEQTVFDFDVKNELAPALIDVCKEVLYIEDNFA